jgi:hypothetical protein
LHVIGAIHYDSLEGSSNNLQSGLNERSRKAFNVATSPVSDQQDP